MDCIRRNQLFARDRADAAAGVRAGRWRRSAVPLARIESVSGCVMLIRRQVFELTGLLDEEYFFSFEDIDFCFRAADKGFRSACVEAAIAYHQGASTMAGSRRGASTSRPATT